MSRRTARPAARRSLPGVLAGAVALATATAALVGVAPAEAAPPVRPAARPVAPAVAPQAAPKVATAPQAAPKAAAANPGVDMPPVDLSTLSMIPTAMGGVLTPDAARTQTSTIETYVWAVRQAGDRIFVGGIFLDVKQTSTAAATRQPFLAAFDLKTGAWDSTCRPQLDNAVYALAVLPSGSLAVGGEFTTVDGVARTGLVVLDPATCAVDPSFPDMVQRPYSTTRAVVRDLTVAGGKLYLVGNFSRIVGPKDTHTGVYKAARVDATTGAIDFTWKPQVTGSGVWGVAVDTARERVHLGGWFSGVGGVSGTGNYAVVDGTTGAVVTGLAARPRNNSSRWEIYDVEFAADHAFVGGSEHILQMLDGGTGAQLAYAHTGYTGCGTDRFTWCGSLGVGGDFQVAERIGSYVFAGCHCNDDLVGSTPTHYSSVDKKFTRHRILMAYDASTEAVVDGFQPDVDGSVDGAWAVASDTNGCLYVGGDFQKGGARAGRSMWVSGIAKLCPKSTKTTTGDTSAPSAPKNLEAADTGDGAVQASWSPSTDNVGVDHYTVTRSGAAAVDVTGTTVTLTGVPAGSVTVTVAAVDAAGNTGSGTQVSLTTGRSGADTVSPTMPTGLAAAAGADGTVLSWTASADAVGVKSYLVYRNGSYVGWSATPSWTDTAAPKGTEVTYALRATDAAGNRSVKTPTIAFTRP